MTVKCMAEIDLHSNNLFCAIVDMQGKRIFEKRLPCHLESVLRALKPFKKRLEKIAVESTYNWYWLVDEKAGRVTHVFCCFCGLLVSGKGGDLY